MNGPDDPPDEPQASALIDSPESRVGLWDYDLDSDVLMCDARWYALLGQPPGSINGIEAFRRHIHPDDVETATNVGLEAVAALMERDQRYHNDFRIVRADGEVRHWRSVACIIVDDSTGFRRAVGAVIDVTDPFADTVSEPETEPIAEEVEDVAPGQALTARELECLRWVSLGKTAWETAVIMDRSQRTIEFHLRNAASKLAATNKIHAVVIAVRRGMI